MKPLDYLLLIAIAFLVVLAARAWRKKAKNGNGCCGVCAVCKSRSCKSK